MCFWWNCVQMCTLKNRYMDKAFEWFSISPGPHHIDYVKSNGGNFRAIFRSFSFSYSKNITNQITDWIGFVNRSLVRICGETQKWISKMREKKKEKEKSRYYGRPLVDWCYHRNKYIHHCDSQENGFCWRNNGNHNQNHSQIRIQFDENSLWFDRIRIYHKRQQQQQHQRTEMLIEHRVRLHPHHQ